MAFFAPERYFARISRIDITRDLLEQGYTYVLLDIDNTILSRETSTIPRDVGFWLGRARDAGITFCLLSNNWHHNVVELAEELGLPIITHAMKPAIPAYLLAMKKVGASWKNTVVIGDQLMTDVIGAHQLGLPAYLVAPLVEKDLPHTLALRHIERLLMGNKQPEGEPVASSVAEQ